MKNTNLLHTSFFNSKYSSLVFGYLLPTALLIFAFLFVGFNGEFAINDDWNNKRHIESMQMGEFRINTLIDTSFIAQAYLAYLWSIIFGTTFTSLRVLTLLVTVVFGYASYLILKSLKLSIFLEFLCLSIIYFNPIVFLSTFTFMTENYFLMFAALGFYNYLVWSQTKQKTSLLFCSFFVGLAILTRQIGVFLAAGLGFHLFIHQLASKRRSTFDLRSFLLLMIGFGSFILLSLVIWQLHPAYEIKDVTFEQTFFKGVIELEDIPKRLSLLKYVIPYFGFYLLPLLGILIFKVRTSVKLILATLSIPLSFWIFNIDLFAMGNVFYVENLYIKNDFAIVFSVLDNFVSKFFLAYLIALSFLTLLLVIIARITRVVKDSAPTVLISLSVSVFLFLLIFLTGDFYERYLTPFFVFFTIFCGVYLFTKAHVSNVEKVLSLLLLTVLIFINIVLNQNYMNKTRLQWQQAAKLTEETGYITQIYVSSTYDKYQKSKQEGNYSGLNNEGGSITSNGVKRCFSRPYTLDSNSRILRTLKYREEKLWDLFSRAFDYKERPRALDSSKPAIPYVKNNTESFIYDEEYPSLLYNVVHKKAYVATWCEEEI